jgi:hypothetical protein
MSVKGFWLLSSTGSDTEPAMSRLHEVPIPAGVRIERDPASADHAVLRAVKAYWDDKRGSRRMPARADIRPAEIKSLLPQVLLADVLSGGDDFRYRLLGTKLRPYFPQEATGQTMRTALSPFGAEAVEAALAVYREVAIERIPLRVTGPGEMFAQHSKFFEVMLMPLGDTDETTEMIFGAFEFDWIAPGSVA